MRFKGGQDCKVCEILGESRGLGYGAWIFGGRIFLLGTDLGEDQ